jgi:beta-ketoacyl-acyl-carrier-protein synthase II
MVGVPRRVVVTGLGAVTPLGGSVDEFWHRLVAGESGVRTLDHLHLGQSRTRFGAAVDPVALDGRISPAERQRLSRAAQMGVAAADEALQRARWEPEAVDSARVGVVFGSSGGGFVAAEPHFFDVYAGRGGNPLAVPMLMTNGPAASLAMRHRLHGPLVTLDTACAAAAHAVGYAVQLIRAGLIDAALTGGADTGLSQVFFASWSAMRALSERNDCPASACRPFSRDRDGLVLGEGAAVFVLEAEESARRRGAPILAEIAGFGMSGDGHHLTQPTVEGPARAMALALEDAGLRGDEIDLVCAHGTGTPLNDKTETAAIKRALGDHASRAAVVSIKGAVGHLMGASGALGLATCVRAITDATIPPTINYTTPDPECDLDYVTDGARHRSVRYAMSNAFAFGGANAVLIAAAYRG